MLESGVPIFFLARAFTFVGGAPLPVMAELDETLDADALDAPPSTEAPWLMEVARAPVRKAAAELREGEQLGDGRYRVGAPLGAGGMGSVHEAHDVELDSTVALKVLSRVDGSGIYRLKNEFRALRDISHRNVVQMYELFRDRGRWCLAME